MTSSERLHKQIERLGQGMGNLAKAIDEVDVDFEKAAREAEQVLAGSSQRSAQDVLDRLNGAKLATRVAVSAAITASEAVENYLRESI